MFWQETKDMGEAFSASERWPSMQQRRLKKRNHVSRACDIDARLLDGGFKMTPILREMTSQTGVPVLTAWRAASGMVHGRLWAMVALSDLQSAGGRSSAGMRITGDEDSMALVFHVAAIALQDAHEIFHQRRAPRPLSPLGLR
jgi:hypothetical protein